MKVLVCGKGGCGKSTIVALLAKEMARRGKKVLVVDSDESNFGLHSLLGVERPKDFYYVLNKIDEESKEILLNSLDEGKVITAIPEDRRRFKGGLEGRELDLKLEGIERLADFLEAESPSDSVVQRGRDL